METGKKIGRPKGSMNAHTKRAREAIGRFVDSTTPHLLEWMQQVAYGIPKVDTNGNIIRDADNAVVWVSKPNPEGAIKAFSDICEYHIPKLQRSDVQVAARVESVRTVENMSNAELAAALLEGLSGMQEVIEGEAVEVIEPTPEWLKNP